MPTLDPLVALIAHDRIQYCLGGFCVPGDEYRRGYKSLGVRWGTVNPAEYDALSMSTLLILPSHAHGMWGTPRGWKTRSKLVVMPIQRNAIVLPWYDSGEKSSKGGGFIENFSIKSGDFQTMCRTITLGLLLSVPSLKNSAGLTV